MAEPKHRHDALFKKTFSVPEHAAAALRAVLPPSLVARLDFSTLSLCSGSFVDETLAGSESDLFDLDSATAAGVGHLVPRLSFVLDDLSHVSDAELESRVLGLVPALTLWALRNARTPERLERSIQHWAKALGELWAAPNGAEAVAAFSLYCGRG